MNPPQDATELRVTDSRAVWQLASRWIDRSDLRRFAELAFGMTFETQYLGEHQWWPATVGDVVDTLAPYHADLLHCLDLLYRGVTLRTRLSAVRLPAKMVEEIQASSL